MGGEKCLFASICYLCITLLILLFYMTSSVNYEVSSPELFDCYNSTNKNISFIGEMYVTGSFRAVVDAFYFYNVDFSYQNGTPVVASAENVQKVTNWLESAPSAGKFECYIYEKHWEIGYLNRSETVVLGQKKDSSILIAAIIFACIAAFIFICGLLIIC